jgi:hypothetical protein
MHGSQETASEYNKWLSNGARGSDLPLSYDMPPSLSTAG